MVVGWTILKIEMTLSFWMIRQWQQAMFYAHPSHTRLVLITREITWPCVCRTIIASSYQDSSSVGAGPSAVVGRVAQSRRRPHTTNNLVLFNVRLMFCAQEGTVHLLGIVVMT